ncbi:hypothetical protein B0T16DRAFT_408029 [Cercophora newfieldiana]|uniref:FAD-binding domain-containing protein n=1 Tax=Cercophora newfieldiana TaxID=92897 RepID=A0AA39Y961_9PEZI|nr:hypothetical protein B0T16DRAFT_408029 [Cercophora newfieldiana]
MPLTKVLIVGAGPSGLLLALLLSGAGIPVELIEQARALDTNPRASHYTAESCFEFDRAGVLDVIESEGFFPDGVSWRRLDGERERLCEIRNPNAGGKRENGEKEYRMVCLPLHRLGKILEKAVLERGAVIRYGWKVVGVGQDEGKAWVDVEKDDGEKERVEGEYVVGCDGANSTVRRKLYGDDHFPGFTWEKQIVATNMYYDFSPYDYDDSQFFVHPEHWHMVAKIQADGLYRVTYGEQSGLTYDELKARQPEKFRAFLPGNPTPDQYKLVNFSPYKVHQRCVKMREGRFLLAADAAHLCNPWGGLGLTGGIADVGSLYDSFVGIHTGRVDADEILSKYDEVRRGIWRDIINPMSIDNMSRLFKYDGPEEAIEKDPFLKMMVEREVARKEGKVLEDLPGPPPLRHDMTQYFKN